MPTHSLLTTVGKNKEAAALANGTPFTITEIAFGDGDYEPTGDEIALQNETGRRPVQASGTVNGALNTAFFETLLEAADGPFTIREGGLFDDDGDMIAIIKYDPAINKPTPESGQTVEALLRAYVVFSDLENLVLQIDAINAFVAAERRIDTADGVGGGGDFSQDRTLKLDFDGLDAIAAEDVQHGDDWFALHDKSAGVHKKINTTTMAGLLGLTELTTHDEVVTMLNDAALVFADEAETIAGVLETKPTHPKGVNSTVKALIGNGANVRAFQHADNLNEPTAVEWANPTGDAVAIVTNLADDEYAVYEWRVNAWTLLEPGGAKQSFTVSSVTVNTDVEAFQEVWFDTDTSGNALTAILPANPAIGDKLRVFRLGADNLVQIDPNGGTIAGENDSHLLHQDRAGVELTYVLGTWQVEPAGHTLPAFKPGTMVGVWAGQPASGADLLATGITFNSYTGGSGAGTTEFTIDTLSTGSVILHIRPSASYVFSVPAGESTLSLGTSPNDADNLIVRISTI